MLRRQQLAIYSSNNNHQANDQIIMAATTQNWAVGLCEIGNCTQCCISWVFNRCAVAHARSNLDGSDCCFNMCFLSTVQARWMLRTAYNIPGDPFEDCYMSLFCPCCVTNQLYQTSKQLGDPYGSQPGQHLVRHGNFVGGREKSCGNCLYACCCCPCAVAHATSDATGMPILMSLFCTTPCASRNMLKVHYRIGSSNADLCEDGLAPAVTFALAYVFCPLWLCVGPYLVSWTMDMLAEVKVLTNLTTR